MSKLNLVNRTTLSHILGKNVSTVDSWVRQGMPYVEKGSKGVNWIFDTTKVIKWRERQAIESIKGDTEDIDYEEGKRRKIAAEAGLLEIDLQKKRGEIIERGDVEQGLSLAYITIKQRLRTIPDRAISQIISETDERLCSELLLNEIDDALLELSQLDFHEEITEPSEEIPSPTSETDNI